MNHNCDHQAQREWLIMHRYYITSAPKWAGKNARPSRALQHSRLIDIAPCHTINYNAATIELMEN